MIPLMRSKELSYFYSLESSYGNILHLLLGLGQSRVNTDLFFHSIPAWKAYLNSHTKDTINFVKLVSLYYSISIHIGML